MKEKQFQMTGPVGLPRGITWERMPGTTEDGTGRQKLMCQAIIEKQDLITVEDLARVAVAGWL